MGAASRRPCQEDTWPQSSGDHLAVPIGAGFARPMSCVDTHDLMGEEACVDTYARKGKELIWQGFLIFVGALIRLGRLSAPTNESGK